MIPPKSDCHCPKCGKLKLTRTGQPHKCQPPSGWQPAETAPKDRLILAHTGYPWPVLAVWSPASAKWCTASYNVSATTEGGVHDAWFENEWESSDDLRCWMPLPKLPKE